MQCLYKGSHRKGMLYHQSVPFRTRRAVWGRLRASRGTCISQLTHKLAVPVVTSLSYSSAMSHMHREHLEGLAVLALPRQVGNLRKWMLGRQCKYLLTRLASSLLHC